MNSKTIFDFIRPKLGGTQQQYNALLRLLNAGAKVEDLAAFVGMTTQQTDGMESGGVDKVSGNFKLSQRSLDRLKGVHSDLVKVVKRAIEITEQDFVVIEGFRSKEQCYINWGKGRTVAQCQAKGVPTKYAQPSLAKVTSLNNPLSSNHYSANGVGKAVDIVPYPITWDDIPKFLKIAEAMKASAKELGVSISYGGDWKTFKDYPHFEIS